MSGLNVNFNKSILVGVNIADSWLNEAASILNCKVGKIRLLYLSLSIGGDPRRLTFWELVVNTIKSRLAGWQSRFLSFRGRLILLKSIWPVDSSQIYPDLSACVRSFFLQGSVRYNLFH